MLHLVGTHSNIGNLERLGELSGPTADKHLEKTMRVQPIVNYSKTVGTFEYLEGLRVPHINRKSQFPCSIRQSLLVATQGASNLAFAHGLPK